MSNLAPYLQNPTIWRSKAIGHLEFAALINALPEAALIMDKNRGDIVHLNSTLLELTAYTYKEIIGNQVDLLFSGVKIDAFLPGNKITLSLNRRKRNPIMVFVNTMALDATEQWLLLSVIPVERYIQESPQMLDNKVRHIVELVRLSESTDLINSLKSVIEISRSYLDADLVSIYKAESDYPVLHKVISEGDMYPFPDTLPSTDLIRLSETTIWMPGKRVLTDIHRFGRANNLVYLGSTPIGQKGAFIGLLVVADADKQPNKYLGSLLDILGATVSDIFSHALLAANLQKDIKDYQQQLNVVDHIFEYMQEGVLVLTPDLRVSKINPAAEKMLEYDKGEVRGQSVEKVIIGADILPAVLEIVNDGAQIKGINNFMLHQRSGQSFLANINIIPVKENNELAAILVVINDESEHENFRMRTRQLEDRAVLGEFAAVFAHDVRNPLNNISTASQLLANLIPTDDPNQEVISRIQNDCNRLTHLMESILAFSRVVDTSKFVSIDMGAFLKRVLDKHQIRFNQAGITPYFQAADNLPKVKGDKQVLERVFENLIKNAIEAMQGTGGTLAVRVSVDNMIITNPQLEITIADNGPGIPDEIKNRVFEPLVTTKTEGTGMGLALAKKFLTDHRGSISVNSFPGGTVFHIYLPAVLGA